MKNPGILGGFVPLIVYGILTGISIPVPAALGAAAALTVLFGIPDLRKGRILTWANLLLFGGLFLAAGVFGMTGLVPWTGVVIYTALAAVTFGSLLAGIPFTLQYAREMVDRTLWKNPVFLRVNVFMTAVWGGIFAVNLLLTFITLVAPHVPGWTTGPLTYLVLIAGIVFTIWYPGHVRKRAQSGDRNTG